MNALKKIRRLCFISHVALQHGLGTWIIKLHIFGPLRFLVALHPSFWLKDRSKHVSQGVKVRLCLERLGPIFIKFGQNLSTRRDLLPTDVADELEKLVDAVPTFDSQQAINIIEQALGAPLHQHFASFDATPLGSASIAQVHAATLHDGTAVVVKVRRPNIQQIIAQDVELLASLAALAEKYIKRLRKLKPKQVVAEFQYTLEHELDLLREAANASHLRHHFLDSELMYVPQVYWDQCRQNVLTMERIDGIRITDVSALQQQGTNMTLLAERGVEIFFTQVFRDCFFHADMHPGNIFVSREHPENPQYMGVDFGIMGTLGPEDQHYLAANFLAFFQRDYRRVAQLHIESGWVPSNTRVDQLESAVRAVCEPVFNKPLKDISFGHTLLRLFQVAQEHHMEVQPQLVLLQKTLLNIEGLGRQLDPNLSLWDTAAPYLEQWMKERMSIPSLLKELKQQAPYWRLSLHDTHSRPFQKHPRADHHIHHQPSRPTSTINVGVVFGGTLLATALGCLWLHQPMSSQHSLLALALATAGLLCLAAEVKKNPS